LEEECGLGQFGLPDPHFYRLEWGVGVGPLNFLRDLGVLVYAFFSPKTVKKSGYFYRFEGLGYY
jgi:hypothetical protein